MRLRNIMLGLKDQLPLSRAWRNLRSGNILGLFHARSHLTASGAPKIAYSSKASAQKAASKMQAKHGHYYSNYKCLLCDGYHIGRNQAVPASVSPTRQRDQQE